MVGRCILMPVRKASVSQGSVSGPDRNRQLWPMISSRSYPVSATKASLQATIGLSGRRGLLTTAAIALEAMRSDGSIGRG